MDRYKHSIYHHISDPFLGLITTRDPSSTRFHACERFHRCSFVAVDHDFDSEFPNSTSHMGKRVIYINPVTMESEKWDLYLKDTKTRLLAGEEINNLVSSLSLIQCFGLLMFSKASTTFSTFYSSRTPVLR